MYYIRSKLFVFAKFMCDKMFYNEHLPLSIKHLPFACDRRPRQGNCVQLQPRFWQGAEFAAFDDLYRIAVQGFGDLCADGIGFLFDINHNAGALIL